MTSGPKYEQWKALKEESKQQSERWQALTYFLAGKCLFGGRIANVGRF
jgi:DUF917 family protein